MENKTITAWLIEDGNNYPKYRTMEDGCQLWIADPWEALWFCREKDAKKFAKEFGYFCRIVEHIFHLGE